MPPTPDRNQMRDALGAALKEARDKAGVSRPQISRQLPLDDKGRPRAHTTIDQWERGDLWPHETDLAVYAALNDQTVPQLWARAVQILDERASQRARDASRRAQPRTS